MYEPYHKYSYDSPVITFNKNLAHHWKVETITPTETKARSNLTYQVKKQLKLMAGTRVSLPGKIKMVN